jgi:hypothetical protein
MTKHYKDYVWKDAIPYGVQAIPEGEILSGRTYKIIMDPYRKRISLEKYTDGQLSAIIYDSALLDFRHLKSPEHAAWQKFTISESDEMAVCLIRNQDDRVIFLETHFFIDGVCRECRVHSPHGYPISSHRTFYISKQDPFNGVILFDQNEQPVMFKKYEVDPETGVFTVLKEANWDLRDKSILDKLFKQETKLDLAPA